MIPQLPYEIISDILFKFKGLEHPVSKIIKNYFKILDEDFNIYYHIEKITKQNYIKTEDGIILVSTYTDYLEEIRDYPRLQFPPELDFIEEIIHRNYI